ncbi:MAG: NAD(P)H-dependent oxidoreductase subunit E [Synergistaceae bacterium]|jgi:NADH-quinone oxidoreductase subunit E|nr:NAD(P)H-dependent oxidoreductase subunit E [Synergistaceae bacterium]
MVFLGGNRRELQEILAAYPARPRFLLPILQDIQNAEKYLSKDAMRAVAKYLGIPDSKVYAVATFYKSLSLSPRGETEVKICMGTACHLRGAGAMLSGLEERLGIKSGETTPDGKISIERVNCLGACALAPVIMVGDKVSGGVTPAKIAEIIGDGA